MEKEFEKELERSDTFMVEPKAENYFNIVTNTVKTMTEKDFQGVFISFQRPCNDVRKRFKEKGINTNGIKFLDLATRLEQEEPPEEHHNQGALYLSPESDLEYVARKTLGILKEISGDKKFIVVDSLDTSSLYNPIEQIMRFSEFLLQARALEKGRLVIVFNLSKELSKNQFIKDIAIKVDKVIS